MSKKSLLKTALSSVEVSKPLVLPKHQDFSPFHPVESDTLEEGRLPHGKLYQGNLPQGGLPSRLAETHSTESGNVELEPQSVREGNLPQGDLPQVEVPTGQQPHGNLPHVQDHTDTADLNRNANVKSDPIYSEATGFEYDLEKHHKNRAEKRRRNMVDEAHKIHFQLSQASQQYLLDQYLASGWGRLAHCITRHLKAPGRHGLKLVDVSVILTVYDCTLAAVEPKIFAPISADEFEESTGMDEKNIRSALRMLVDKKILHKITWKSVNFWGINLGYFIANHHLTPGKRPQGKSPQGNLPHGNAPCDKAGNLPGVTGGQITPPNGASSGGNYYESQPSKNLLKESKKESSFSYENELSEKAESSFPDDLLKRWNLLEMDKAFGIVKKEKSIFQKLHQTHGQIVFDYCGRVLAFLEKHGTGKDQTKIQCPMIYIENHWESNLSRFQEWERAEQIKKEREESAAKSALEREERGKTEAIQLAESEAQRASVLTHLANVLGTESLDAFAEEAITVSDLPYLSSSWSKSRWNSIPIQMQVVNYFLEIQSGRRRSQVLTSFREETA